MLAALEVITKSHQLNKWHLIFDLSSPSGHSVNDGIPKELCSMSYISVDDAVHKILGTGPCSLLANIDIKSAFLLIPVHPADRQLLECRGIDTCLPFGLQSVPRLFNIAADLLKWILKDWGITIVIHYPDNFLTIGSPESVECQKNLKILKDVCHTLGFHWPQVK